jgi:hypothetical protein
VGTPGTVAGVTADEAEDAVESPTVFLAITVKLTGIPFVRPVNVAVRTFPSVTAEPTDGVTIYPVMAEPPLEEGADHVTTAEVFPGAALTFMGTPGTVAGVIGDEGEDVDESPRIFLENTVKVTAVPFVRSVKLAVKTLPTVTIVPLEAVTI